MKNTMFMKRLIYIIFSVLPLMATSQNMYNITSLLENAPSGTARFVSMGGSMGALGGDLSVMGTNPAGAAVYRSSDFNITGVYDIVKNNSKFGNKSVSESYNGINLSNMGFLIACETDESLVKYVNFGGNFRRKLAMRNNFSMNGAAGGYSQQYVMDYLYRQNSFTPGNITSEMYGEFQYDWLTMLASDAGINDKDGNFLTNPDGTLIYNPTTLGYYSEVRGSQDIFDMNISVNINDMVYIGATLGVHSIDYSRYTYCYEDDEIGEIYSLSNDYRVTGTGYDFKIGAIFRPFENLMPFRIGVFAHTPVFYRLVDCTSATMVGPFGNVAKTQNKELYGDDLYTAYNLKTPWRLGAAVSYTFGRSLALNAEYEFANAAATSFTGGNDIDVAQNVEIDNNLKTQHTVRLGAEYMLGKYALRAGYNYISSPFRADAYKCIDNTTISETSTEYMNNFSKNIFTLGAGYTGDFWYFDVAYMCQMQNSDFYLYDDGYQTPVTKVETVGHSIVAGIGFCF